jgi:hypothetical protein
MRSENLWCRNRGPSLVRCCLVAVLAGALISPLAWGIEPKESSSYLGTKTFFQPELYISNAIRPLDAVLAELPNRAAWEAFRRDKAAFGGGVQIFVDQRSGAAANIVGAFPLIPGRGVGNDLSGEVDRGLVAGAVVDFARAYQAVLGIDVAQLGEAKAAAVTPELWQVSIPQSYRGVPVRHGRLAATIKHGNLVLIGAESWGDVRGLSTKPRIGAEQALAAGFDYVGGRSKLDEVLRSPVLEILPLAVEGQGGGGYGHVLAWTWAFVRPPELEVWEVIVDAASGEVLSFEDLNHYAAAQIVGGVYPLTSTEICPNPEICGTLQSGWPMPWADTGQSAPNNFTNSGGVFDHTGGTVTTTLSGQFVNISDTCGSISESSSGDLDLGGANGDHDCDTPAGASSGNTSSSRTAFYELNRIAEQARGWLPGNSWLQNQLTANVNLNNTCNAFYTSFGGTVNFYRSGGGCRNTGELAGVFDHEWGHALDDNDSGGSLSNTSEAYADIAMLYRLHTSCIGHGFWWTSDRSCGMTSDGTGFNGNERQTGGTHCDTDCSGVRDADWAQHFDNNPDTPLNFVCSNCSSSSGPCGRQVHCAAAPPRQAAWDLVARDLPGAGYDGNTSFIIGNKLFYQGSGNIGLWYNCSCGSSSDGCGAANAYMQWVAADDDNGTLTDGTPHMAEIFAAFDRHGIACSSPTPQNGGCGGGPSAAPANLSATPGDHQASLSWDPVAGASEYWVFRTEGVAGCDFGKVLVAEVTGTSYVDTEVAGGREYHYTVVAAGSSSACFGPAATCQAVTPTVPTQVCDNDGVCESGEDCNNCSNDCPSFPIGGAVCGNNVCETGPGDDENCITCPQDCNGQTGGKPSGRFCCGFNSTESSPYDPDGCGAQCTGGGNVCTETPTGGGGGSTCCGDGTCEAPEDSANCEIDCGPPGFCGDNMIDPGESCDGSDLGGQTCLSQGCTGGGTLACLGDCSGFDTSGCIDCCLPRNASCTLDSECCSGDCKNNGRCR